MGDNDANNVHIDRAVPLYKCKSIRVKKGGKLEARADGGTETWLSLGDRFKHATVWIRGYTILRGALEVEVEIVDAKSGEPISEACTYS